MGLDQLRNEFRTANQSWMMENDKDNMKRIQRKLTVIRKYLNKAEE